MIGRLDSHNLAGREIERLLKTTRPLVKYVCVLHVGGGGDKGPVINYGEGGLYKIGKLQVWKFLRQPLKTG